MSAGQSWPLPEVPLLPPVVPVVPALVAVPLVATVPLVPPAVLVADVGPPEVAEAELGPEEVAVEVAPVELVALFESELAPEAGVCVEGCRQPARTRAQNGGMIRDSWRMMASRSQNERGPWLGRRKRPAPHRAHSADSSRPDVLRACETLPSSRLRCSLNRRPGEGGRAAHFASTRSTTFGQDRGPRSPSATEQRERLELVQVEVQMRLRTSGGKATSTPGRPVCLKSARATLVAIDAPQSLRAR